MEVIFHHHHNERVLEILFPEGWNVKESIDIQYVKNQWITQLKNWHSPYTCIFDFKDAQIKEEFIPDIERLFKFFQGFFMKKLIGFYEENSSFKEQISQLTFVTPVQGYDAALKLAGLGPKELGNRNLDDFRQCIVLENDFAHHIIEISFIRETHISTLEEIKILKDKLQNNLRQWHTPYFVVFNLAQCTISEDLKDAFTNLQRFLKSLFCMKIIGYAPKGKSYPFPTYRVRHQAMMNIEQTEFGSGSDASCSSRK